MAEEKTEDEASVVKPPLNKKMIIIIVVALLAVILSVGATIFFLSDSSEDSDTSEDAVAVEESEADEKAESGKGAALYLEVTPAFLVTLDVGGRQRYMKVDISLLARQKAALDAVEHHMPLIRSRLLSIYSSANFGEVQTESGKITLQENTLKLINDVLTEEGEPLVENVFFTNFVLQ